MTKSKNRKKRTALKIIKSRRKQFRAENREYKRAQKLRGKTEESRLMILLTLQHLRKDLKPNSTMENTGNELSTAQI